MLKFLKRWLGWDSDSSPFDFSDLNIGWRQRLPPSPPSPPPKPAAAPAQPQPGQAQRQTATPKKPKRERAPMEVLDNPRLTLDRPTDDGFDPYNTGAFNRSASWERIGRHKKR
jgi:hypothetical protein